MSNNRWCSVTAKTNETFSNKHWSSCHSPEILKGCQRACHRLYFVFSPNSEVWVIKYIKEKKKKPKPKKTGWCPLIFNSHEGLCSMPLWLHWSLLTRCTPPQIMKSNSETHGRSHLKVKQNKPLVLRKNLILLILQVHKLNSGKSETEFSRSYSTSISSQPPSYKF